MASDLGSELEEDSMLEASLMEWASKFKPQGTGFLFCVYDILVQYVIYIDYAVN